VLELSKIVICIFENRSFEIIRKEVNKRKLLNGPPSLCGPRPSGPRPTRGNPLHRACAQSHRSLLRQTASTHSLMPPIVSLRRFLPAACLSISALRVMPPTIAVPMVCPRLYSSSPPARDRPPWFFTSPTVHTAMAICATRQLLPALRPVSFSPLRCAIQFPSPSRLCIVLSSPAAARARRQCPLCRPPEQPPACLRPHLPEQCPSIELPATKPSPQEVTKAEPTPFAPDVRAPHRRPHTSGPPAAQLPVP
jgi:hypothetical protein